MSKPEPGTPGLRTVCGVLGWRMGTACWAGKDWCGVLGPHDCRQANRVREEPQKSTVREVSGLG